MVGNCSYDYIVSQNGTSITTESPGSGGYDNWGYDTEEMLDRVCMPSANTFSYLTAAGVSSINSFQSLLQQGYLMNLTTDVRNNWQLFLAAIGLAIVMSFIIMFLMRCIAGIVVWVSIIATILALVALGLLLMYSGGQFGDTNQVFMGYKIPTVG